MKKAKTALEDNLLLTEIYPPQDLINKMKIDVLKIRIEK
jgi:hypothetical protein